MRPRTTATSTSTPATSPSTASSTSTPTSTSPTPSTSTTPSPPGPDTRRPRVRRVVGRTPVHGRRRPRPPRTAPRPQTPTTPRQRDLTIYVHLADPDVAGVENTRSSISVEQVKDWCQQSNTKVTVRPVIDLNDNLTTDSYAPTDRIREQAVLTNTCCVFANCTRPSRRLDLDHLIEWVKTPGEGGPTSVVEPRTVVQDPPPLQDPRRLESGPHRTDILQVDQPPRACLRVEHPGTPDIPTDQTPPAPSAGPHPCLRAFFHAPAVALRSRAGVHATVTRR